MINQYYHRGQLTPREQAAYDRINEGLRQHRIRIWIPLKITESNPINRVVNAVHLDHPEFININWWNYNITSVSNLAGSTIFFTRLVTDDKERKVLNQLNSETTALKLRADHSAHSIEGRYLIVINHIARFVRYHDSKVQSSESLFWEHSLAGPLCRHYGVCEGVSALFSYYCNKLHLPCSIIAGTKDGMSHSWNVLELFGHPYYIDVTYLLGRAYACFSICAMNEKQMHRKGYAA